MDKPFPKHISSEKDLILYEDYLNEEKPLPKKGSLTTAPRSTAFSEILPQKTPQIMLNHSFFQGYLKNHIGKPVQVESLFGNQLHKKVGILFEVGANYIVLKLNRNSCSMLIESSCIKYVTIIHDMKSFNM